jgi:hypothetical protein
MPEQVYNAGVKPVPSGGYNSWFNSNIKGIGNVNEYALTAGEALAKLFMTLSDLCVRNNVSPEGRELVKRNIAYQQELAKHGLEANTPVKPLDPLKLEGPNAGREFEEPEVFVQDPSGKMRRFDPNDEQLRRDLGGEERVALTDEERGQIEKGPQAIRWLILERRRLIAAIKRHRDERGDDRCQIDDNSLYAEAGLEPADFTMPPRDKFLADCARFYDNRCTATNRPSYSELETAVATLSAELEHAQAAESRLADLGERTGALVSKVAQAAASEELVKWIGQKLSECAPHTLQPQPEGDARPQTHQLMAAMHILCADSSAFQRFIAGESKAEALQAARAELEKCVVRCVRELEICTEALTFAQALVCSGYESPEGFRCNYCEALVQRDCAGPHEEGCKVALYFQAVEKLETQRTASP